MTEPKFTPGPWECNEVGTASGRAFRIGKGAMLEPGPKGCCIIYDDYGHGDNERKANAHLIAAAPDLYEALVAFADHFGPLEDNEMLHADARHCFKLARAALAKARGET